MPATQYIGTTDFTLQPTSGGFVQGQGWTRTVTYRGSKSKLNAFFGFIFAEAIVYGGINGLHWTEEGPYATVDVTYATSPFDPNAANNDPISNTWTLTPNLTEVDIGNLDKIQNGFRNPVTGEQVPGLDTFTTDQLIDFRSKLNAMLSGDTDLRFLPGSLQSFIFGLKAREQNSFQIPQYALKKTLTVFSQSQIVASHTHVGKIHNYTDLISTEPTLNAAILIDPLNLAQPGGKPLNWLKMAPEVDQVAGGKYQIIQEYWGFQHFNPFIYDTVSTFTEAAYHQKPFAF